MALAQWQFNVCLSTLTLNALALYLYFNVFKEENYTHEEVERELEWKVEDIGELQEWIGAYMQFIYDIVEFKEGYSSADMDILNETLDGIFESCDLEDVELNLEKYRAVFEDTTGLPVLRDKGITEALIRGISNDEWIEILTKADNEMYDLVRDYAKFKLALRKGK